MVVVVEVARQVVELVVVVDTLAAVVAAVVVVAALVVVDAMRAVIDLGPTHHVVAWVWAWQLASFGWHHDLFPDFLMVTLAFISTVYDDHHPFTSAGAGHLASCTWSHRHPCLLDAPSCHLASAPL